jgi:hypothetical protein
VNCIICDKHIWPWQHGIETFIDAHRRFQALHHARCPITVANVMMVCAKDVKRFDNHTR